MQFFLPSLNLKLLSYTKASALRLRVIAFPLHLVRERQLCPKRHLLPNPMVLSSSMPCYFYLFLCLYKDSKSFRRKTFLVLKTFQMCSKNQDLEVGHTFFSMISLRFNKKLYLCN